MSVYDHRNKPAYGIAPHKAAGEEKNPYILKWWTPNHDQAILQTIREYQWQWFWHIQQRICAITPVETLDPWRQDDPACKKRAWYNVLMNFSLARADECGFGKLVRTPVQKNCRICELLFREDSLPVPLVERLGVEEIDFCSPCLTKALIADGAGDLPMEEIIKYLRDLTSTLSRIPPADFGRAVGDLHGLSIDERIAVFRILMGKPTLGRVKNIFGSWLNALIKAGVLADDVRRTARGIQCIANDGHVCLSLGEKTIDDILFSLGIEHDKEPRYPGCNYRADFKIGNTFVEYFGLAGDADYDARSKAKASICAAHDIKLIAIYPKDLSSVRQLKSKIFEAIESG